MSDLDLIWTGGTQEQDAVHDEPATAAPIVVSLHALRGSATASLCPVPRIERFFDFATRAPHVQAPFNLKASLARLEKHAAEIGIDLDELAHDAACHFSNNTAVPAKVTPLAPRELKALADYDDANFGN